MGSVRSTSRGGSLSISSHAWWHGAGSQTLRHWNFKESSWCCILGGHSTHVGDPLFSPLLFSLFSLFSPLCPSSLSLSALSLPHSLCLFLFLSVTLLVSYFLTHSVTLKISLSFSLCCSLLFFSSSFFHVVFSIFLFFFFSLFLYFFFFLFFSLFYPFLFSFFLFPFSFFLFRGGVRTLITIPASLSRIGLALLRVWLA